MTFSKLLFFTTPFSSFLSHLDEKIKVLAQPFSRSLKVFFSSPFKVIGSARHKWGMSSWLFCPRPSNLFSVYFSTALNWIEELIDRFKWELSKLLPWAISLSPSLISNNCLLFHFLSPSSLRFIKIYELESRLFGSGFKLKKCRGSLNSTEVAFIAW